MNTFIYIVYSVWCNADFKHCDLICHTAFLDLDNSYADPSPRMGSGAWDYSKGESWQVVWFIGYVIMSSLPVCGSKHTHTHTHMHTHLKSFHFFTYVSKRRWWISFSPPSRACDTWYCLRARTKQAGCLPYSNFGLDRISIHRGRVRCNQWWHHWNISCERRGLMAIPYLTNIPRNNRKEVTTMEVNSGEYGWFLGIF